MIRAVLSRREALAGAGALTLAAAACSRRETAPEGLLRVAIDTLPDSLDPARGQFASAALLYKQLHAGLTEYGPDGALAPGLAERWETPDGGRSWVFHLRSGLKWSDSAALTADDVVWSVQRLAGPGVSFADIGDFYALENIRAVLTDAAPPESLGISAPDPLTVVMRLDHPVGVFPLLMREFYPFPRHVIDRHGPAWVRPGNMVTAGAYGLSGQHALGLRLERNPHYYAADAVRIPAIAVDAVEDGGTRARLFRAGDFDLAARPPPNQIPFLRRELGPRFRGFPAPILTYIKPNHARPGLSDPRVRRALSMAIDRGFICQELQAGASSPAETVIPAAAPVRRMAERRAAARALLAEAGWGGAERLRLELRVTSGEREGIAVAIADDLGHVGVECAVWASPPLDLYQAVDAGEFDLALARYDRGLKADPLFMLEPFAPGGFANNFGWADDEYAALMAAARAEAAPVPRAAAYTAAEARLLEQEAMIPLFFERAWWLAGARVTGLRDDIQPMLWRDLALAPS